MCVCSCDHKESYKDLNLKNVCVYVRLLCVCVRVNVNMSPSDMIIHLYIMITWFHIICTNRGNTLVLAICMDHPQHLDTQFLNVLF